MGDTNYGLLSADAMATGGLDRRAAHCHGTYGYCLQQLAYYPDDVAERLRLCVWCERRGWTPSGSDE